MRSLFSSTSQAQSNRYEPQRRDCRTHTLRRNPGRWGSSHCGWQGCTDSATRPSPGDPFGFTPSARGTARATREDVSPGCRSSQQRRGATYQRDHTLRTRAVVAASTARNATSVKGSPPQPPHVFGISTREMRSHQERNCGMGGPVPRARYPRDSEARRVVSATSNRLTLKSA